jgi:hypothetical protein
MKINYICLILALSKAREIKEVKGGDRVARFLVLSETSQKSALSQDLFEFL